MRKTFCDFYWNVFYHFIFIKETSIYNVRFVRNTKFSELSLLWKKCFSNNKMYMLGKCWNQCASCYVQNSITVNEICRHNLHSKFLWNFSQLCPWEVPTSSSSSFFNHFIRAFAFQFIHLCVNGIYSTWNVGLNCTGKIRCLSTASMSHKQLIDMNLSTLA